MTPEELELIALKFGGISESVKRRNLGTGDRAASDEKPANSKLYAPEPRSDHVHTLRAPTGPLSISTAPQASADEAGLNQLETRFLGWLREQSYPSIGIHRITFKLASGLKKGLRYTPDFDAIVGGRWTFFEVKGPQFWDDARKSLVVVAAQFPWLDFYLCRKNALHACNPTMPYWQNTHVKP